MVKLEEIDLKIIYYLQEDARMSVSEISKRIGVSRPTVKAHIEKLERDHVIEGYTIKLNPEVTMGSIVLLLVETKNRIEIEKIEDVVEINKISSDKYLVKMNVDNFKLLKNIFNEKSLKILEIMPVIEHVKKDIKLKVKVPFRCDYCGKEITDEPVTYKYRNKIYFFCCQTCLKAFRKSQKAP